MRYSTVRRCVSFVAVLVLVGLLAPAASSDVGVPDVVGRTAAEAEQILEGAGFEVRTVDIAEGTPGVVVSQVPSAGDPGTGAPVEVRVGTAMRIMTVAPDARGRDVDQAVAEFASAYVIDVEAVDGPEEQRGKVLDQEPAPGQQLLLRGVLRLFVVEEPGAAGVTVPEVVGRPEAEARAMLEDAGLHVAVTYVQDPAAGPGIVVYQDPPCCGEILSGGTIALRVNGETPVEPAGQVPVPPVTGLSMHDASQTLLAAGLVPQYEFKVVGAAAAWTCVEQDPLPDTPVAAGSPVRIVIGLPVQTPTQLRVPPLYGLGAQDAVSVLASLHLQASVVEQFSMLPAGRVFGQSPLPGTWAATGSTVNVVVAKAPPGNWTPTGVLVPDLSGLTPGQAFVKLVLSGLWGHGKQHVSPNAPLGVVDAQNPGPGAVVPPGTVVAFYVPEGTQVPAVVGHTKSKAVQLLTLAGLNAQAQGPAVGFGATKVTSQSVPPGTPIAKGSTVAFTYEFTGGVGPLKTKVPALVGLTKSAAASALQAKGLNGHFLGPAFGIGATEVISQSVPPNTLVLVGTTIQVHYKFTGPLLLKVKVPNVIGMTKAAAAAALQGANLQAVFQGPAFGLGTTQVIAQNPVANVLVNVGSQVVVQYKFTGGLQPLKVQVPPLVGLTKAAAGAALQAKGLVADWDGPNFGLGVPKVVAQNPPAGALVNAGSTVHAQIQWSGGIVLQVKVPNLLNLTKKQALDALTAAGLKSNFVGPQFGLGTTKVTSQAPGANALVALGTTVTVHYKFTGMIGPLKVKVPNVIGKTKAQAQAMVQAAGLKAKFVGLPFGHVAASNPAVGTDVILGSWVTMSVGP